MNVGSFKFRTRVCHMTRMFGGHDIVKHIGKDDLVTYSCRYLMIKRSVEEEIRRIWDHIVYM